MQEVDQHIVPFEDLPTGSPRSTIVATGPGVAVARDAPFMDAPAPAPDFVAFSQSEAALQDSDTSTENAINIPWWVYGGGAAVLAAIAVAMTVMLIIIQRRKRNRMHAMHTQQPALDSSLAASEAPAGQYGQSLAAAAEGSFPILGRNARSPFTHTNIHANALAVGSGTATGTHSHSSSGISSVTYATAAVERFEHVSTLSDAAPRESNGTLVSPMVPGLHAADTYSMHGTMHASHARSSTQGSAGRKGATDWTSDAATHGASPPSAPWLGTVSSKAGSDHPFNWSEGRSGVELGSMGAGRDSPHGAMGVWGSNGRGGGGWGTYTDPWLLSSVQNGSESIHSSHNLRSSVPDARPSAVASTIRDGGSINSHTVRSNGSMAGLSALTVPMDGTPSMVSRGAVVDSDRSLHDKKHQLGYELDHLRHTSELFLGRYVVLSVHERREGGQGVVQFMRSALSEEAVAVKFFLSRSAFEQETALYSNEVLKGMMPATREVVGNTDGVAVSSRGYQWPPFIVLEKGESLQEWAQREEARYSTIMDVRPCFF